MDMTSGCSCAEEIKGRAAYYNRDTEGGLYLHQSVELVLCFNSNAVVPFVLHQQRGMRVVRSTLYLYSSNCSNTVLIRLINAVFRRFTSASCLDAGSSSPSRPPTTQEKKDHPPMICEIGEGGHA